MMHSPVVYPATTSASTADCRFENKSTASARHPVIRSSRLPLSEATGNAQTAATTAAMAAGTGSFCAPSALPSNNMSPSMLPAHIPTPMMNSASQGGPSSTFGTGMRVRKDMARPAWRVRNRNPFYDYPQFRQYRQRQEQREEKDSQKWPPVLEDPFLDALLLIPDMGRSKYFMHHSLHGRNMIISMYVWMAYQMSLPPGVQPSESHKRDRKAISSHIQVLKAFFKDHRFLHFFLPTKDEEQRRRGKHETRTIETVSLKNNPVLVALAQNRFPDVRPNYDYWAHLLAMNQSVTVRPKTCWEFVSSPDVALNETRTALRDGAGNVVDASQFPQVTKCLEEGEAPPRGPDGSLLLHEYTRAISQTFSATTKEVAKLWEDSFPALYEHLHLPEPQDEEGLTILEMTTTLELHRNHFPSGSELNGLIEMTIALPALQNHRWRCVTRLARPRELCSDQDADPVFLEHEDEVGVQYTHQPGCGDGAASCDCMLRPRQDVRVPFPATEWAAMLTNCASYPPAPSPEKRRRGAAGSTTTTTTTTTGDEEGGLSSSPSSSSSTGSSSPKAGPTQQDLVAQIGMLQELWSCPPHGTKWTRQALVLWRFRDKVYKYLAKEKKWVAEPPGTSWRFLTVNDPASDYHLKNAYVSSTVPTGPARSVESGGLMNNPGGYGSMGLQDFSPWATDAGDLRSLGACAGPEAGGLDFGAFHNGLTTPPPTATLHSSYGSSLDQAAAATMSGNDLGGGHQLGGGFLSTTCSTPVDSQTSSLLGDVPSTAADPFLSATAVEGLPGALMTANALYGDDCDPSALQHHHWEHPVVAGLDSWSPGPYGIDADAAAVASMSIDVKAEWEATAAAAHDWEKGWNPAAAAAAAAAAGLTLRGGWDDGVRVDGGGCGRFSPGYGAPDGAAALALESPPPLTESRGTKRGRTDSLDLQFESRKMMKLEGGVGSGVDVLAGHGPSW